MKIINDINSFSKTLSLVIPNQGVSKTIAEGENLFNEPTLKFQSILGKIPDILKNKKFVFANLSTGLTIRTVGFGSLFVLAETQNQEDWSNIGYRLKNRFPQSFKIIAEFEPNELLIGNDIGLTLYGIEIVKEHEHINFIAPGELAVVIADIDPAYSPTSETQDKQLFEECMRLSTTPIPPYYGKALKDDEYYKAESRGGQCCPTITMSNNGTLFAAFFCNPLGKISIGGENNDTYGQVVRSFDGGITWEDPLMVIDPDKEGPARIFDLMLWSSEDKKRIFFSYTLAASPNSIIGGKMGTWITYTDNPEDATPDWSTPIRVFDGVAASKPIKTSDGNWYWATSFWAGVEKQYFDLSKPECRFGMHLYRSKDSLNWEHLCHIKGCNDELSEPALVENEKGKIMLIKRRWDGTRYLTANLNDLTKWSESKEFRYDNNDETSLQMNLADSRIHIEKLPSGNLIFVYHDIQECKRCMLTAALSCDGGITWPHKLLLEERNRTSYPIAQVNEKGEILIIYDQGRTRRNAQEGNEILYARIREEDIKAGKLIHPRSVLKRLVTRYGLAPKEDSFKALFDRISEEMLSKNQKLKTAFATAKENPTLENYLNLCKFFDENI